MAVLIYTPNIPHDASILYLIQSSVSTISIFQQFIVVQRQVRIRSITNCQSWLIFKGRRTVKHHLNAFSNKKKRQTKNLYLSAYFSWTLSMNQFDTEMTEKTSFIWVVCYHIWTPVSSEPVHLISESNIYSLQKRCQNAVMLDLGSILKSKLCVENCAVKDDNLLLQNTVWLIKILFSLFKNLKLCFKISHINAMMIEK